MLWVGGLFQLQTFFKRNRHLYYGKPFKSKIPDRSSALELADSRQTCKNASCTMINGQVVKEVDDDHFSQGLVGLAMEGYAPGGKIVYDFIDISLRTRNT